MKKKWFDDFDSPRPHLRQLKRFLSSVTSLLETIEHYQKEEADANFCVCLRSKLSSDANEVDRCLVQWLLSLEAEKKLEQTGGTNNDSAYVETAARPKTAHRAPGGNSK